MENRALLRDCCEQMGVSLGEKETEQFMTYLSLLLEWNEKMNRLSGDSRKNCLP